MVQHSKERGLLEDVDMISQTVYVHDLYREFARLEAQGKLNESKKRRWVFYEDAYPTEVEMTLSHGCWQNLIRIRILGHYRGRHDVQSLQGTECRNCANVVVLKLDGLFKLQGDVNLKDLICLRSLDLINIGALDSLDGLQDLNNLTYFGWIVIYTGITLLYR